jgi:cytochrome c-type biogenesis protein CcmH
VVTWLPFVFSLAVVSLGSVPGPDLEREARAIEAMLVAPCCFTQSVAVHQSAAAAEVREDVRARLAAGETRQQILDAYVRRYGKRVLTEPPAAGFDAALYVAPVIVFLGSIVLMLAVVRRFTAPPGGVPAAGRAPQPAPAGGAYQSRLDTELRDLD